MTAEDPMATLTKWIVNVEQHEKTLLGKISDAEKSIVSSQQQLENLQGMLFATKKWLEKFRELHSALESTNQESLEILDREQDPAFLNELGTHFDRIQAFLKSRNNAPQTIAEIEDGTKIPRTSISAVLYRTHTNFFRDTYIAGKRGKSWSILEKEPDIVPPPPTLPPESGFPERVPDADIPF
jgi:predicted transcriptional regulator